jgi:hypothetical protein
MGQVLEIAAQLAEEEEVVLIDMVFHEQELIFLIRLEARVMIDMMIHEQELTSVIHLEVLAMGLALGIAAQEKAALRLSEEVVLLGS